MNETIRMQILAIRESGATNMFVEDSGFYANIHL